MSEARIRLLEAIGTHGSLSRAAKDVPLSYKAAWDTLDAMNSLSELPLVVRTTGGQHGGGTQLTAHGRHIVALYRAMESSQQDILNQLAAAPLQSQEAQKKNALRTLIRRMSVKTSARNQFEGRVVSLDDAAGLVHVGLELAGAESMVACVTSGSVRHMGLVLGAQAHALVKAPAVSLTLAAPRRHASRNAFRGHLTHVSAGESRTEATLVTATGLAVTASLPNSLAVARGVAKGQEACASFAFDSVILATFA